MRSVYIHIPFCNSICSYCDFCKMFYNSKYIDSYLDNLELEIKARYQNDKIKTIYLGGGTPSSLSFDELKKLFSILKIFNLSDNYEFTMECNLDVSLDKIRLMKDNGVNRVSLGVQSFDSDNLKILERTHTKKDVFKKVKLFKKNGIDNINIDLIYGVNDNISVLKKDLNYFLKLDIPHISCYSLIIEDHTKLGVNKREYISEDIDYKMYKLIEDTLTKNNYIHYEISNYSKAGYSSKHNLTYWNNSEYYGFGLSSVEYIDNIRRSNTKNLEKYLSGKYLENTILENEEIQMENEMILGLRKLSGVSEKVFFSKYHKKIEDVFDIIELLRDNKVILENDFLRINKNYLYLSNEILINFIKEEENG